MINIPPSGGSMIDMTYFAPYNADIGFRFGVEAIFNNTQNTAFYAVVASLCPTASFYDSGRSNPPSDV